MGLVHQRLVQGLSLWPNQVNQSDMQMLKESSNISIGVAKLTCESRIPNATLPNSRKTVIYKAVSEWGYPQREGYPWEPGAGGPPDGIIWAPEPCWSRENSGTLQRQEPINSLFSSSSPKWGHFKPKACQRMTCKTTLNMHWPQTPRFSNNLYFQCSVLWPHRTTSTPAF